MNHLQTRCARTIHFRAVVNTVLTVLFLFYSSSWAGGCGPSDPSAVSGLFPQVSTPVQLVRQEIHLEVSPDFSPPLHTQEIRAEGIQYPKVRVRAIFTLHNPTARGQHLALLSAESYVGCNNDLARHDSSGTEFWIAGRRVARHTQVMQGWEGYPPLNFDLRSKAAREIFQRLNVRIPARGSVTLEKRFTVTSNLMTYFLTEGPQGGAMDDFWQRRFYFSGVVKHTLVTLEFSYPAARWAFQSRRGLADWDSYRAARWASSRIERPQGRVLQYRRYEANLQANSTHRLRLSFSSITDWKAIVAARQTLSRAFQNNAHGANGLDAKYASLSDAYLGLGEALLKAWSYEDIAAVFDRAVFYAQKTGNKKRFARALMARLRAGCDPFYSCKRGQDLLLEYENLYSVQARQIALYVTLERVHLLDPENAQVSNGVRLIRELRIQQ